ISFTSALSERPTLNFNDGDASVLVGWLQPLTSAVAGGVAVGTGSIPIPTRAAPGDRYGIEIRQPPATSDRPTRRPLLAPPGGRPTAGRGRRPCPPRGSCPSRGRPRPPAPPRRRRRPPAPRPRPPPRRPPRPNRRLRR